jgi:hypothetical protein
MMDTQKIKQQVEAGLFNTNQLIVEIDRTHLIDRATLQGKVLAYKHMLEVIDRYGDTE